MPVALKDGVWARMWVVLSLCSARVRPDSTVLLVSRAGACAGNPEQDREVRATKSAGRGQPPWGIHAAQPQR